MSSKLRGVAERELASQNAACVSEHAVGQFTAACARGDWDAAEHHRLVAVAGFEASLDHLAAGWREVLS